MVCFPFSHSLFNIYLISKSVFVPSASNFRDMSRDDFGEYYRRFLSYTAYLIHQNRLSERERNSSYLRGFPQPVRARILQRLSVKKPDILPDDGYDFADIHEAASFIFSSGSSSVGDNVPTVVKREPVEQTSVGDLVQAMSDLTKVFTATMSRQAQPPPPRFPRVANPQPTPGGVVQNPPRWGQPSNPDQYQQNCMFCSAQDHFVRNCPVAAQYLQQGKVIRNGYGKLALPDGSYPPRNAPGKNMRERVDNFLTSQGIIRDGENRDTFATNFLEGPDKCVFAFDIAPHVKPSHPSSDSEGFDEVQVLQAQIDSLREAQEALVIQKSKKAKFDGVEILTRTGPPRRNAAIPPPPTRSTPNTRDAPPKPAPNPTQSPSNIAGKPGAHAGDLSHQRPQGPMRPVTFPTKPSADDPKYRYRIAVETDVKTSDIADRALDAKITISARELLATSPDVRRHVKDVITSKKVSANSVEIDEVDAFLTSCFDFEDEDLEKVPKPVATYLDLVKYDPSRAAAVSSLPLRVIYPSFSDGVKPECILDGGAQVVVMRKDIWERLRAPIVANKAMPMESANASTSMTLGLIENHPIQLGPITFYLQIQVVENAPFEVLLGCPFFDVANCEEISRSGGNHQIRVHNLKDDTPYMFPTHARVRKTPQSQNNGAAVNFRQ